MEHRSLRLRPVLRAIAAACLLGILVSCSAPVPIPTESRPTAPAVTPGEAIAPPTAIPVRHAAELRFALLGEPGPVNGWALFDEAGASYANAALHSGEYPTLYRLSVPKREFEPYLAEGMPSSVIPEGSFFTATVKLKNGLYWSDGSPLTAADVAFTAQTALAFRLGLDWAAAYNPELLDHVEAMDAATMKFVFKKAPSVGEWQYGVLQGPILSEGYWSPKLAEALGLLPSADLIASVEGTRAQASDLQAQVDADIFLLGRVANNSQEYKDISERLTRNQNELNSLNAKTAKLQDEYDAALNAAQGALFALSDDGEPTFGPFLRYSRKGDEYIREANPSYPFAKPNFDRLSYIISPNTSDPTPALDKGQANVILDPRAISGEPFTERVYPGLNALQSPTRSARFIVINPLNATLADPALRQALSCALDRSQLAHAVGALPLDSFILPGFGWDSVVAHPSCAYTEGGRSAADLLKAAGYGWSREPLGTAPGEGLNLPDGSPMPTLRLLVPTEHAYLAKMISMYFSQLGISLDVQTVSAEDVRYAVFSTGDYDLALLGWRLSDYPGYLCDWFQPPGIFALDDPALMTACKTMQSTPDPAAAQQATREAQAVLMKLLPFIPLLQGQTVEYYQGVTLPFESLPDGLAGLFGAPELAIPR